MVPLVPNVPLFIQLTLAETLIPITSIVAPVIVAGLLKLSTVPPVEFKKELKGPNELVLQTAVFKVPEFQK
jgi:hypothetical protein